MRLPIKSINRPINQPLFPLSFCCSNDFFSVKTDLMVVLPETQGLGTALGRRPSPTHRHQRRRIPNLSQCNRSTRRIRPPQQRRRTASRRTPTIIVWREAVIWFSLGNFLFCYFSFIFLEYPVCFTFCVSSSLFLSQCFSYVLPGVRRPCG